MYQTVFKTTVDFTELQKNDGITYQVIGVLKNEEETEIRLTDDWIPATQTSYEATMPNIKRIKVQIKNSVGELNYAETDVEVNKQQGVNWLKILDDVKKDNSNAEQIWQKYSFIAGDVSIDASQIQIQEGKTQEERTKAEQEARHVNDFLAKSAFDQIRKIP